MEYKVTGRLEDEQGSPLPGLFVEVFDSDLTGDDFLGVTVADSQGKFEVEFDEKAFKGSFEILERRPDVYVVVRDSYRVLHKTEIQREAEKQVSFDIVIKDTRSFDDPYSNSFQRMIASFNAIGDTLDISQADLQRLIPQMIRVIAS